MRSAAKGYKVVCISLYLEDIDLLRAMVSTLKARGLRRANKSQVIRAALQQLDLNAITPGGRP